MNIDAAMVMHLISTQFPEWKALPVAPIDSGGWDNRTFRVGKQLTARLPSDAAYEAQVDKEQRWLPVLGPQLPLPIPQPVALGSPDETYPWKWSIYRWLEGTPAEIGKISNLSDFATTLGRFLTELQKVDAADGPEPGSHNFYRGGSLDAYDDETRRALAILSDSIDGGGATAVWERALATTWASPAVWFHGDISSGNILLDREGAISAVIDFGTCGVGDPACDLAIAWTLFDDEGRDAFQSALALDEETWARGRGWAVWKALIVAAGLAGSNSVDCAESSRRTISSAIADHRHTE